jgi:hypothetical protein
MHQRMMIRANNTLMMMIRANDTIISLGKAASPKD